MLSSLGVECQTSRPMNDDFVPPEGFVSLDDERRRSRRRRARPHPVFDDLRLSDRRNRAVALGWRIKSSANGAGVFSSHDILPGSIRWPEAEGGQVQWADILFLPQAGHRPGRIFNATIYTLAMRMAESVCDQAEEAVEARVSDSDRQASRLRMFTRRIPGSNSSEMIFSPHRTLPSLDGMTREGAQAAWLRDRWGELEALCAPCQESAKFLPGYAYGTGLDIVSAHTNLTVNNIADAIAVFRSRGETGYQVPVPFPGQRATVEAILRGKLWRWDSVEARAQNRAEPDLPDGQAGALLGYESNAIDM